MYCRSISDSQEILITGRARSGLPDAECALVGGERELLMVPELPIQHPVPEVFSVREPYIHRLY